MFGRVVWLQRHEEEEEKKERNLSKKEIYPPFILLIKIWKRNSNILIVNEFFICAMIVAFSFRYIFFFFAILLPSFRRDTSWERYTIEATGS